MIGGTRTVTGLDVGSTKTCAVILESTEEGGGERVLGVGLCDTEGVRSDEVTDLEATTRSVREAVREAEMMAGLEVRDLYVGVAGRHVRMGESSGVVAISGEEVSRADVDRVHEVGRAVVIPPDRELLHAVPQEYRVDGRSGIQAPVGMAGTRLESDVCLVTAASATCKDLRRAVDKAGYAVDELVLESLAGGLAVLRSREREAGVALVEIGGAATDVVVFVDDKIRRLSTERWGGATVTGDIVKGLGVPVDEAERLKREHGAARGEEVDPSRRLEVEGPSPDERRTVPRELLVHIIEQRLDEILGLVYEDLAGAELLDELSAGLVLAGGGSALPGTVELARDVFNLPVRLGDPGADLTGFADAVRKPKFATAVGLARYGKMRGRRGAGRGAGRVLARVMDWLTDFF